MPRVVRNALSAVKGRQIKEPGRYADGNGLYLHLSETGARWWVWRGVVKGGRRRELGLVSAATPEGTDGKPVANESTAVSLPGHESLPPNISAWRGRGSTPRPSATRTGIGN